MREKGPAVTVEDIHAGRIGAFEYVPDQVQFGQPDFWQSGEDMEDQYQATGRARGDCEDWAAWVVHLLRAEGRDGRMVYCLTETGEGHAVADNEGVISCCRQATAKTKEELRAAGYQFLQLSGLHPGDPWTRIK